MSKILREARRAGGKVQDLLAILPERRAQNRRDRCLGQDLRRTDGAVPNGQRVALFVIWQPAGLTQSTFLTCDHLVAQGYAPVAISNAPLGDADRTALVARSCQVIERPNLGHDFGAWRDVLLLWIRDKTIPTERLLLLNDSVWFPLAPRDDLLDRMGAEADSYGFTGAIWMERPGRAHRAHYQSYLLMFGRKALDHKAFVSFWNGYLTSSRRDSVLVRGEKGLTSAMAAAGLVAPPVMSPQQLLGYAEVASKKELARILDYAAFTQAEHRRARDDLLVRQHEDGFREKALALIAGSLFAGYFAEAHPYLVAKVGGLHVLKKRQEQTSIEGRRQYLRAVAAGDLPDPSPIVLTEIRARTP